MGMHRYLGLVLVVALGGCATFRSPEVVPAGQETAGYAPGENTSEAAAPDPVAHLLAPPAWPPEAVATAPPFDAAALERRIHDLVNEVRDRHGLAPLAWSPSLWPVARAHSEDMARRRYFAHVNPDGEDAAARALRHGVALVRTTAGGYVTLGVGENLSLTHRYAEYRVKEHGTHRRFDFTWRTIEELAWQVVASWLQSPRHRANLLSPVYGAEAIGVFRADNEAVFITQNFLTDY
ncbi:MAG: hypothetical protein KatS3mg042_1640 [Rhodothermaceae bacterium]|nr:MAG: hypothetical protein KatS3mg042_1640 [Rhodothermaceae bacterium]